jgi:hypothetical protein
MTDLVHVLIFILKAVRSHVIGAPTQKARKPIPNTTLSKIGARKTVNCVQKLALMAHW